MNKTFLIIKREFLSRVQKKSFLLTTILTPLIIPLLLTGIIYLATKEDNPDDKQIIEVLDETHQFNFKESSKYEYVYLTGNVEGVKTAFQESEHKALLYIPNFDLYDPDGITIYSKSNLSINAVNDFENAIERKIEKIRLEKTGIDSVTIANLNARISIRSVNLTDSGEEKESNAGITFGIGYLAGFMIYMFVFIYGAQIMHGVIEEKSSRVVEVLISSVKPFQLMMGKVLGIASVGLVQLLIWVILVGVVYSAVLGFFGISGPQDAVMGQVIENVPDSADTNAGMQKVADIMSGIPFGKIAFTFIFYFIGGYLMYGALFAAVGSAVDSQAEAQQFMFPITIPMIVALVALSTIILQDPDSSTSFWFSIIPLTSPIAMMGRIAFEVPAWQMALSMLLLVGGFVFTIWIASRVYRVGILIHGTKVNYKVLVKWFFMKG